MLGIEKLPRKQKLLLGKILLIMFIPVFLICIFVGNVWDSIKDFCQSITRDVEHEVKYFVKYITTKD